MLPCPQICTPWPLVTTTDASPASWQYTTILDAFDHWQALLAGLLGFAAAIIAVILTLRIEQRKTERELDALRKSLAYELRQQVPRALGAGLSLREVALGSDPITARVIESYARLPTPLVYPANADKIGLLGQDAMNVVIFYSLMETCRGAVTSLMNARDPDNISKETVAATANALITACEYAQNILPKFKTGVPRIDQKDQELMERIEGVVQSAFSNQRP
jgi:hypothetical protein